MKEITNSNNERIVLRKKYQEGHFNADLIRLVASYFPDVNAKQCGVLLEGVKEVMNQALTETNSK